MKICGNALTTQRYKWAHCTYTFITLFFDCPLKPILVRCVVCLSVTHALWLSETCSTENRLKVDTVRGLSTAPPNQTTYNSLILQK